MHIKNILNSKERTKILAYITPKEKINQLTNLNYTEGCFISLNLSGNIFKLIYKYD